MFHCSDLKIVRSVEAIVVGCYIIEFCFVIKVPGTSINGKWAHEISCPQLFMFYLLLSDKHCWVPAMSWQRLWLCWINLVTLWEFTHSITLDMFLRVMAWTFLVCICVSIWHIFDYTIFRLIFVAQLVIASVCLISELEPFVGAEREKSLPFLLLYVS